MYRIAGLPVGAPVSLGIVGSFFPRKSSPARGNPVAARSRRPVQRELTGCRADGQARVIHNEGEMVLDENGKAVRVLGTMQDITDRKRAEESLRESEDSH